MRLAPDLDYGRLPADLPARKRADPGSVGEWLASAWSASYRSQVPRSLLLEFDAVLQPAPPGALALADFFDFSVYVDARADHIRHWFLTRLHTLRDTAFTDPQSPFRRITQVSTAEVDAFGTQVWKTINEVNLTENIQPTRARATLVLHKGADHRVTRVRLRRSWARAGNRRAHPRTTMRYDRAWTSLDGHATYIAATYIAGAARQLRSSVAASLPGLTVPSAARPTSNRHMWALI